MARPNDVSVESVVENVNGFSSAAAAEILANAPAGVVCDVAIGSIGTSFAKYETCSPYHVVTPDIVTPLL